MLERLLGEETMAAQVSAQQQSPKSANHHGQKHGGKRPPFFPKPLLITKVIAPLKYEPALLRIVAESGLVELIEVDTRSDVSQIEYAGRRQTIDELFSEIQGLVSFLERYGLGAPKVKAEERVHIDTEEEAVRYAREIVGSIGEKILHAMRELEGIEKRLSELDAMERLAKGLLKLGVSPSVVTPGSRTVSHVGTVFPTRFERLRWELQEKTDNKVFVMGVPESEDRTFMLVVGLKEDEKAIWESLRQSNFERIELPEDVGEAHFDLQDIREEKLERLKRKEELEEQFREISKLHAMELLAAKEGLEIVVKRLQLLSIMRRTKSNVTFWAWIAEKHVTKFRTLVENATEGACMVSFIEPDFEDETPTLLDHKSFFQPVTNLVTGFGVPSRKEVDPMPFVLILYPIFFGIMFADLGQGLLLSLIGLIIMQWRKRMVKVPEGLAGMLFNGAELLVISGLSAAFFGLLFGSFFGDEVWIRTTFLADLPLVKQSLAFMTTTNEEGEISRNYVSLLLLSFAVGFITLTIGLILNVYNKAKTAHHKEEVYLAASMLSLYVSFGIGAVMLFVFKPLGLVFFALAGLSLVGMTYLEIQHSGGVEGGMLAFDHTLTLVSHTVSFSRLLAMNTVHFAFAFLAYKFVELFTGAKIIFHDPAHWEFSMLWLLGAAIGTAIIIPVEGVFSTLQSMRLTWVEFFSKFFDGSGTLFAPHEFKRLYTKGE